MTSATARIVLIPYFVVSLYISDSLCHKCVLFINKNFLKTQN